MDARFASIVDPLFEAVIELLARLESGRHQTAEVEHQRMLDQLCVADANAATHREWELAKYAIVSWIDEMVLSTPWSGREWWSNHILEMELFQSRLCSVRFFESAEQSVRSNCLNALEVYLNCVILGFRGVYFDETLGMEKSLPQGFPVTLSAWIDRHRKLLQRAPDVPLPSAPLRERTHCEPLSGQRQLIWWSVAAAILVLLNMAFFQWGR
jgi:type VI secretion system protein ImpK